MNITANIVEIGASAFNGCTGVTELTIGRRVATIGGSAFYNCKALIKINYNAIECADLSTGNNVFLNAGRSGLGIKVKIGTHVKVVPTALFNSTSQTGADGSAYGYRNYKIHSPYIFNIEFASGSVCVKELVVTLSRIVLRLKRLPIMVQSRCGIV